MISIKEFEGSHLLAMKFQANQQHLYGYITESTANAIKNAPGQAYTVFDNEDILAVAGVIDVGEGRGYAWSYISQGVGAKMLKITRAVKRYLSIAPFRRIEMSVDCDFPEAHRWANMLGFTLEAERMRSYTIDGRDCSLYAMVKS